MAWIQPTTIISSSSCSPLTQRRRFTLTSFPIEKYCSKTLPSGSSCSGPWRKCPMSTVSKIPITRMCLKSSELRKAWSVYDDGWSQERSFLLFAFLMMELISWFWQTPFWRCADCYNWIKMCAAPSGREITKAEGKHPLTSGLTRGALRLHCASCTRLCFCLRSINKHWKRGREPHSLVAMADFIRENKTVHLHTPFTLL